jgi:hypothetical protein
VHAGDERIDTTQLPERTALLALLLLEPVTRPRQPASSSAREHQQVFSGERMRREEPVTHAAERS